MAAAVGTDIVVAAPAVVVGTDVVAAAPAVVVGTVVAAALVADAGGAGVEAPVVVVSGSLSPAKECTGADDVVADNGTPGGAVGVGSRAIWLCATTTGD